MRPLMLKAKSSENCPAPKVPHFGGFRGLVVRGYKTFGFLLQKAHLYVDTRRLRHSA